jgi:hypothetical protein
MLHKILQVYCILAHVQGMSQDLQLGAKEIRHGVGVGASNPQIIEVCVVGMGPLEE